MTFLERAYRNGYVIAQSAIMYQILLGVKQGTPDVWKERKDLVVSQTIHSISLTGGIKWATADRHFDAIEAEGAKAAKDAFTEALSNAEGV